LIQTEKFYLFDVGIANYLSRHRPRIGGAEFGKSFEHWVLMELMNFRRYRDPELDIRFWRTSAGQEVARILPGASRAPGRRRAGSTPRGGPAAAMSWRPAAASGCSADGATPS